MNNLGLDRITPSMICQYEQCPLNFFYQSWLGLKLPQPVVHFKFGTAIHEAIAKIWTTKKLDDGIKIFTELFLLEHIDIAKTDTERIQQYGEMLADGKIMLKEFYEMLDKFESVDNIHPEQFELAWKEILSNPETKLDPLEVPLSCRIDCLAKNHTIVEFKTSSKDYDIFETRLSPQALCYAWIYLQKFGVIPTIHYIVLIKKRKKEKIQHLEITYRMTDLLTFHSKLRSIIEGIRNREFRRPLKEHPYFCECEKFRQVLIY